jgi:hypothetical protein
MNANYTKAAIIQAIEDLGLSFTYKFIPWSQSRNKVLWRSLNWKATLLRNGKPILSDVDYSAGDGHCPASQRPEFKEIRHRMTVLQSTAIDWECQNGYKAHIVGDRVAGRIGPALVPDDHDVLHGLLRDGEALNYAGFEEWAVDNDYDADSRKAEAIYRTCLKIALALRNGLGEDGLSKLVDAFQDY